MLKLEPNTFIYPLHSMEYTLHMNKKRDHALYGCNVPCGLETSREAEASINMESSDQNFSDIGSETIYSSKFFYLSTPLDVSVYE